MIGVCDYEIATNGLHRVNEMPFCAKWVEYAACVPNKNQV